MLTRYGVWLDHLALHDIDPTICITDIQEQPGASNVVTHPRAAGHGLFVTRRSRESLSVVVRFAVREYDVTRRKAIVQRITAWAKAGRYLSVNDRPGQVLCVEVDELPTITSALKWTQDMAITFTAYALPFWRDEYPTILTTSGEDFMLVPGDADSAQVDASIRPDGDSVTISVGDTSITLEGISNDVEISHGDDGILRITSGGESIFAKRTPQSSDDLLAVPGRANAVSITGGTATVRVRGCWS